MRLKTRSTASPRGTPMRIPGWSASATLRIEEALGTKKVKSLCMYGGEQSATVLRAGSITRNATSHALVGAPSSTAPGLGYSTGWSLMPICAASARARSAATPNNSPVAGSLMAEPRFANPRPTRSFPFRTRSETRGSGSCCARAGSDQGNAALASAATNFRLAMLIGMGLPSGGNAVFSLDNLVGARN